MIPSIIEILRGLLAGRYEIEQAEAWINTHIELGADTAGLRDHFAGLAMQALVTGTLKVDDGLPPTPETLAMAREYADASYVLADAMLNARSA